MEGHGAATSASLNMRTRWTHLTSPHHSHGRGAQGHHDFVFPASASQDTIKLATLIANKLMQLEARKGYTGVWLRGLFRLLQHCGGCRS